MKISYAITVCNELEEVKRLVNFLLSNKQKEDEIVILVDISKEGNGELRGWLNETKQSLILKGDPIKIHEDKFQGHFANWKNLLTLYCTGDYIFQIDADEIPCTPLIESLPSILESNPEPDVLLVPRVNTVEGLTQEHIQKWGWNVNSEGWVNWPDFQWRIYRNTSEVRWVNKVHERLEGFKTYTTLPMEEDYSLYHPKTIERQERQNNYYDTL
jgi:glycosyltransferase involved in cell wall biosynthesis